MSKNPTKLDLPRVGEQIDVLLTEIYGKYVAQGSPTKLGGLRFLDVESAKTFAFEKSDVVPAKGNLIVLSAPFGGDRDEIERQLKEGPHSEKFHELKVRGSSDVGKQNKQFVEASYFVDTMTWLADEKVAAKAEQFRCDGRDAVVRILKENVLGVAGDLMEHFITIVRAETRASAPTVMTPFG